MSKIDHIQSLREKAELILLDKKNWVNDQGWVSRQVFGVLFMPSIDVTIACRAREADLKYSDKKPDEPLHMKVSLGKRRVCRRVESGINKEYNEDKTLIRLVSPKLSHSAKQVKIKHKDNKPRQFGAGKAFTVMDETLTLAQWSKKLGVKLNTLQKRLSDGWSIEDALTTPMRIKVQHVIVYGVQHDLLRFVPADWVGVKEMMPIFQPHVSEDELIKSYNKREDAVRKHQEKKRGSTIETPTFSREFMIKRGLRYFTYDILIGLRNKKLIESQDGKFRSRPSVSQENLNDGLSNL
jgi:hypothetical protein